MSSDMVELHPMKNEFDDTFETRDIDDIMIAAPPEEISDDEVIENSGKPLRYKKVHENTSAGRLQLRVPDAPENLIELIFRKKCLECNSILGTITSSLAHYNCTKHQNKLAFLFLPYGIYNLPLSKEEIREIETGASKDADAEKKPPAPRKMPFRDLVKRFEINEDVRKLDMEFCRLCECPFSSKVAALQHYSGKKHKKNAENWSPYNPQKPIDTKDDVRCDVCNVIVSCSLTMESHLTGRKHAMKLKAYLERVDAGAIAPPMSSRGFCDFNNVEREEANPLDPSKFVQEMILPKNLMGSFVNREEVPSTYDEDIYNNSQFSGAVPQIYESDYSGDFKPDYRDIGIIDSEVPYGNEGYTMGGYNIPERAAAAFQEGRMPPPPWAPANQIPSRTQINSPYAPHFQQKMGNKFPVQAFGPTKFKYSHAQPY